MSEKKKNRKPCYGLPTINSKRYKAWKPIITQMGPRWGVVKIKLQVVKGMQRAGVAEFHYGQDFSVGRLTPVGVALRDMWHSREAQALDRKRKRYKKGRRSWKQNE
jgi:hypothetical protein